MRIGNDQPVTLQERIDLQKVADHHKSVASWLGQAKWRRHLANGGDGIDRFLDALNWSFGEPDDTYLPGEDDIEGWFGGAPGWLRRS